MTSHPTDPLARAHAHHHAPRALPAELHRAAPEKSPEQIKQRRAARQSHGRAQSKRGIGRGAPEDSFAPDTGRPPRVRCGGSGLKGQS